MALRASAISLWSKRIFGLGSVVVNRCRSQRYLLKKYSAGSVLVSWTWFSYFSPPAEVTESENNKKKRQDLIDEADQLFKQNKQRDLVELLKCYKDSDDVELLWRLVRAQYNLSIELATSPEEKKSLTFEAYKNIKRSLELDDNHFANHKWMAIMLNSYSSYTGIKARISCLETIKQHMMRATELNPKDATTLYMLGVWCYQITDMPWFQRKIASTIFATPPSSSFEEALEYFMKAEEAEPRFYSKNLLMLGKTYLKLNKEDRARYYLDLACNYPPTTDEDHLANQEAHDLLSKLKDKK